jgi:hypothetical protein
MTITITISNRAAQSLPPIVRMDTEGEDINLAGAVSDEALVAHTMLQAAAYLFAQGQPVEFGAEVSRDLLK